MTDHNVEDFIESILADRAPDAFAAAAEDAEVLRIAAEMRALRGDVSPERQFVETLHKCLAGAVQGGTTLLPFPTGVWHQDDAPVEGAAVGAAEATPSSVLSSRHETRKGFGAAGKAAAAVVLVAGTFTATNFLGGHRPTPAKTHVAAVGAVRSAELVSVNGRLLGQTYLYRANPSWVFVDVQHSGLAGTYMCQLRLADGHDVTAGTLVVGHGSGEWAHTVDVDVSQLRTAALETPAGQVVATATFS